MAKLFAKSAKIKKHFRRIDRPLNFDVTLTTLDAAHTNLRNQQKTKKKKKY